MKNSLLFLFISLFLFTSCDSPCGDPALVEVPASDASAPEAIWQVTILSNTPSGPISALTQFTEAENSVSVSASDQVTVTLIGKDEQSGVKSLKTSGGFGYTCNVDGGSFIADGILPTVMQSQPLTTCGMKEWKLPTSTIDVNFTCGTGTLANGSVGITSEVINGLGATTSTTMTIQVMP